jgi:hypothetical protein
LRYFAARRMVDLASSSGSTVFHGLDNYLACVVWDMAQAAGKRIFVASDGPHDDALSPHIPQLYVHPRASKSMLRSSLPRDTNMLIDIAASEKCLQRLRAVLPHNCIVLSSDAVFNDNASQCPNTPEDVWKDLIASAGYIATQDIPKVRPSELLQEAPVRSPLTTIDWSGDEKLSTLVQPLNSSKLFSSNRTYLLMGLTGELGQFLCRWMVKNGARHIVISSR